MRCIQALVEEHGLLLNAQMGGLKGRSTETALDLLTTQIHTIWDSGKHIASLLSLDISGAFDTVNSTRLLHVLRSKGLPAWLVRWVQSFLSDRTTTLLFDGEETEPFSLLSGVP